MIWNPVFPTREDYLSEDEYDDAIDEYYDALEARGEEKREREILEKYEADIK